MRPAPRRTYKILGGLLLLAGALGLVIGGALAAVAGWRLALAGALAFAVAGAAMLLDYASEVAGP